MADRCAFLCCLLIAGIVGIVPAARADAPARLELRHPQPYQVVQREGFDPPHAHEHEPGGPALGFANVPIELLLPLATYSGNDKPVFEYRVVALPGGFGASTDWAAIEGQVQDRNWSATARVAAGGWYRLEVRARRAEQVVATGNVEPFGVGEVFVIAGQSYAVGANDEITKVEDPHGRVVAFDAVKKTWQVANDPQPNAGDGGTIWPTTGNLLLPLVRVPVGFVNVAVGGTSTRQWLPGEELYNRLAAAGSAIGRFRAVLWQQGESDVIEHRDTDYYVKNLVTIRKSLAKQWGFDPPWLLAKSTLHPTVYKDPAGEGRIRAAIDQLWSMPGFRPGPDTDILDGDNRGGLGTRRHFSGLGQRRAGLMWFAALWQELNRAEPAKP
jgi:Carbohydrate esterase, sialic acid-specific acetylesterase